MLRGESEHAYMATDDVHAAARGAAPGEILGGAGGYCTGVVTKFGSSWKHSWSLNPAEVASEAVWASAAAACVVLMLEASDSSSSSDKKWLPSVMLGTSHVQLVPVECSLAHSGHAEARARDAAVTGSRRENTPAAVRLASQFSKPSSTSARTCTSRRTLQMNIPFATWQEITHPVTRHLLLLASWARASSPAGRGSASSLRSKHRSVSLQIYRGISW